MNAIPKIIALACFFIGFGLSLGCMVYSILNLVRTHRKRKRAIKAANLLEPMTPEEFQRKIAKLEGKPDA